MQIEIGHDIKEANGKTIRENNLEKKHKYQIGALVELNIADEYEWDYNGARLFVVKQTRDCDGTPLYCLCANKNDTDQKTKGFYRNKWHGGFSEEDLILIKE